MGKKIAVSEGLTPVKKLLNREGYDIINLENDADISGARMKDYAAVIISGMDDNLMGMEDVSTKALVISAEGKDPEEILQELRERRI